ncbi:phage tail protein [Paenibacillus sp. NPDC056579]|uniref:phage tail protein n=1 Tax=unclassified Paenibacillus TaxID=185978 RepID=UPI001EF86ACC|nr:tail fiber protein [Paenibacillus sp. H1-7]ULL19264.1 phage tail protein [Paenibacillus sp. H1-7]
MADPFIGEIRMFGGNFAPLGWLKCDGQLLSIAQYSTLYTLIGTTYGGDGVNTFALPDLRGRLPIHQGTGAGGTYALGQAAGTETVTLTTQQIPAHSHTVRAFSQQGDTNSPNNAVWANSTLDQFGADTTIPGTMHPAAVGITGGSQPHENMMPYLCVHFIIATEGIFPSQG